MKRFNHIRYFWYVTTNWGLRIGLFTLWHELRGERKYNISTNAFSQLNKYTLAGNTLQHATEYMPVNYLILEELMRHLPADTRKYRFLDIGCGEGRAVCLAAHYGFTKITGIDFAKELVNQAIFNASLTQAFFPSASFEIQWKNILDFDISTDTCIVFLFNPFDEPLMKTVVEKIVLSWQKSHRHIYVCYASPNYRNLFTDAGFQEVFHIKKVNFVEGIILQKSASD